MVGGTGESDNNIFGGLILNRSEPAEYHKKYSGIVFLVAVVRCSWDAASNILNS